MRRVFLYSFLLLIALSSQAQTSSYMYWVGLKNKDSSYSISEPRAYLSSKALERRARYGIAIDETDLPVNHSYIQAVEGRGVKVHAVSKWLNALVVDLSSKQLADTLKTLAFVKEVVFLGERKNKARKSTTNLAEALAILESKVEGKKQQDTNIYGRAFKQIHMLDLEPLQAKGINGTGVMIAVLDEGFTNVNKIPYFKPLFDDQRVITTRDCLDPGTDVYDDGDHGTAVLSCMAIDQPHEAIGTAPKAEYVLVRTEDHHTETLIEEAIWVVGAEFADSMGADVLHSSLGYNEFDDISMNHRFQDLDGKTTIVSRGAAIAALKGMVVINSAGNEGQNDWRHIAVPADAEGVIVVGGVDPKGYLALFSSPGPTADKRIKPDVMAMGEGVYVVSSGGVLYDGNGTSYSAPLISGLVASLVQACPHATGQSIAEALRLSGDNYYDPDKYYGYGIPDAVLALKILGGDPAYPVDKNQLLDIRFLHNKQMHVTYHLEGSQKVDIRIIDGTGQEIYMESWKMKEGGTYRAALKKTKKLKAGNYLLTMKIKDRNYTLPITKG